MAAPPALTGKRRAEAKRLLAAGVSAREIGRKFGVDHKTVAKLGKTKPSPLASPTRFEPSSSNSSATPPGSSASNRTPTSAPSDTLSDEDLAPEQLLDDDLRLRVEMRGKLLEAIRAADDPRELAVLTKELGSCLDGIRKVISAVQPEDDGEEDVEAGMLDSYMLRLVQKARVAVNAIQAEPGVPGEAEQAGEVGDRVSANGTHG